MEGSTEERFKEQQARLLELGPRGLSELEEGTIVVLPSITFPPGELRKIIGIQHYEERLLFMLLLLRRPGLRIVYVTSTRVDDPIVEYYLRFVPDPESARRRLYVLSLWAPEPRAMTEKLLERPDAIDRLRSLTADKPPAYILPFNVTPSERELSVQIGAPVFGAHPDLTPLGSKSGSRRVAQEAGVPVLPGAEDLRSVEEVERAIAAIRNENPGLGSVVIKLNDGFSGQGNAIVSVDEGFQHLDAANTVFCASEESWASFGPKIAEGGAVVEEHLRMPGLFSPSVQMRIYPDGGYELVSTHDQILGGPDDQVYLGCRFPARAEYRSQIQEHATRIAKVLAGKGVIGSFGIDFVVAPGSEGHDIYLSEINLRMGGTTHPFLMARLATGGTYDEASGELIVDGTPKCYVASDNLKSKAYVGLAPQEVISAVDRSGIAFDRAAGAGVTLHLLGALRPFGKLGAVCIADSIEEAEQLLMRLEITLEKLSA